MSIKLTMRESIEGMKFSSRLSHALINLSAYAASQDWNLDNVIAEARRDRGELRSKILRVPNAGGGTANEFFNWLDSHLDDGDYSGRVTAVALNEAELIRRSLENVCNSVDARSQHYRYLRKLQHMLDSATLHIEQPEDSRSMFNRNRRL